MKRLFLVIMMLVVMAFPAWGATYYVDGDIVDTNVASATCDFTTYNPTTFSTSTGIDCVYKTIADINLVSLVYGDSVLMKKGGIWREQLNLNLLKILTQNNRDFSAGTIGNWIADVNGTGSFAYDATNIGGTDNKQALLNCGTGASYAQVRLNSTNISLAANTSYTFSMRVYVPAGNTRKKIQLLVGDFTGATGSLTNTTANATLVGNTWTTITGVVTLSSDIVGYFGVRFFDGPANGDLLYFDDISITSTYVATPVTISNYGTGVNPIIRGSDQIPIGSTWTQHTTNLWEIPLASYGGNGTIYMGWRGTDVNTDHPSTNGRLRQVATTAFYTTEQITAQNNRDFSSGTIGNWVWDINGTGTVAYNTTNIGGADNKQVLITCGTATYAVARISNTYAPISANTSYQMTARVYVPAGNTRKKVCLDANGFSDATGSLATVSAYLTLAGDTWTTITGYVNIGTDTTGNFRIYFYDSPLSGDLLYFDDVSIKLVTGTEKTYAAATGATSVRVYSASNPNTYAWEFASRSRTNCISLVSAPHVTIDGVDCQLSRYSGLVADFASDHLIYKNSTTIATGHGAVWIQAPYSLIDTIAAYSVGNTAFYLTYTTNDGTGENGATDSIVQNSTSKWAGYYEPAPSVGVASYDNGCIGIQQNRCSAINNLCESNGPIAGIDASYLNGQIATYRANNVTIKQNTIIDSGRNAISLYCDANTHHITTAYNLITDWARMGEVNPTHSSAIYAGVAGNNNTNWNHVIDNNTIVSTLDARQVVGVYVDTPFAGDYQYGTQIVNNIIASGNSNSATVPLYFSRDNFGNSIGPDARNFIIDNNDYYFPSGTYATRYNGTYYNIANWRALNKPVIASDVSTLVTDPLFISPSDFHLQSGSPAISAGIFVLGVHDQVGLKDFAGQDVYGMPGYDIGAYGTVKPTVKMQGGTISGGSIR